MNSSQTARKHVIKLGMNRLKIHKYFGEQNNLGLMFIRIKKEAYQYQDTEI
jgi:hypothetical protein